MTWNLWWRFGDWRARRPAILAVLREQRPDVLCVQEVWDDPADGSVAEMAEALGLHWAHAPSPAAASFQRRAGEAGDGVGVGNAVLSRWPITDSVVHELPDGDGQGTGRVVLHALVDAPDGPVPVFTTHLTSPPAMSALRCEQVTSVARFVADHAPERGHPPVLTGDFNAEPDSDELRLIGGHKTAPVVPGMVLIDAWAHAEWGDPGHTWLKRNPNVAEGGAPNARIDYVLVGSPRHREAVGKGLVRSVRVAGDHAVDGVWPSDHAAVVVDLETR